MAKEMTSKRTRNQLREILVEWVLREIGMEFEAAGVECDRAYQPAVTGERRSLVERHYHTLDFSRVDDVRRFLVVLESVLRKEHRRLSDAPDQYRRQKVDDLLETLKADGFVFTDGKVVPETPAARLAIQSVESRPISEVTRRNITDNLQVRKASWSGRLSEIEFLDRIYKLADLPSSDGRFKNASGDIFQHRVNNFDWDDWWILTDGRFELSVSDEAFLRFLCEMVHPVVRSDDAEVRELVTLFNEHLAKDGWEIYEADTMSGKPVYGTRLKSVGVSVAKQVKVLTEKVNSDYIAKQTARMEESVQDDPELAIGTAKELVESVCKTILDERGIQFSNKWEISELTKATFATLDLVAADVPEKKKGAEIIKKVLGNLAHVTQGLAELRNLYGTGHGKHGRTKSILPRHARLAVGASSTLAVFLYETHLQRPKSGDGAAQSSGSLTNPSTR